MQEGRAAAAVLCRSPRFGIPETVKLRNADGGGGASNPEAGEKEGLFLGWLAGKF